MAQRQRGASRFILGPAQDFGFVLGMPLIALALLPLSRALSSETVWAIVMSFGAVGHHLPGFIRTYGDRALYARYRWRFLLAPPFLLAANIYFSLRDLHGMALITIVWSLWHGMMQHFGFMRIYDTKAAATAPWIARLDWWISFAWFSSCLVASPNEAGSLLEGLCATGFGTPPPWLLHAVTSVVVAATALLSAAYLVAVFVARRRGTPMSPLKLLLLVGTSGFLVFARVITGDQFLTAALFEVLHDVQYLAIVWAFNHRLVEAKLDRSGFARGLFGAGSIRPIAYVLLCLGYGAIAWFAAPWEPSGDGAHRVLLALLATSGLLHFYYDGFIWKVRQPETQAGLGLVAATAATGPGAPRRPLLHAAWVIAPVIVVACLEALAPRARPLDRARSLVQLVPRSGAAQAALGDALLAAGAMPDAIGAYERALLIAPGFASARARCAEALRRSGRSDEALAVAERALSDHAGLAEAHLVIADVLAHRGERALALDHFRAAIAHGADDARAHNNYAQLLAQVRRDDEAIAEYRLAVARAPTAAGIRVSLGVLLANSGHAPAALIELGEAVRLTPDSATAQANLGAALARAGRRDEALVHLSRAVELDPGDGSARRNLEALSHVAAHQPTAPK